MLPYLIKFGIPEKEARLYLALLELGPSSVSQLAKRAKVSRTNSYHLLTSLMDRGLVTSEGKDSRMRFSAESPDRILDLLKSQEHKYRQLHEEAKELMSEFKSRYNQSNDPIRVRFFDGVEGVIRAYEDTLTAQTEIYGFASVQHEHEFFPGYFPAYYTRRTQKGIPIKLICAENEESKRIKDLDHAHLRHTYIVPKKYDASPEINVYDDKVAIMSLEEPFGVLIENKQVAQAFRHVFELATERAAQYDREKL